MTKEHGGVPTLYGAEPNMTLVAGTDFTVPRIPVGSAERFESQLSFRFPDLTADTWFAVVVRGTAGVSRPMFPVCPLDISRDTNTTLANLLDGNLNEGGVMALGFTNELYADVDRMPGFLPRGLPD